MIVSFMLQFLRSSCLISLSQIFLISISDQISGDKVCDFEEVEASYEEELNATRLKIQQLHIEVFHENICILFVKFLYTFCQET